MKPVRCEEIAVKECEVFAEAPQGSQWAWSRIFTVFLFVNSQHRLGIQRKRSKFPGIAVVISETGIVALSRPRTACG